MCEWVECGGIFVSENVSDIGLLLYADDLVLVNDTVGRLQKMLYVLSEFCNKYDLKINLAKSNIMVFRNGRPLHKKGKWYIDGKTINTVSHYKYLGAMFSSKLKWSQAINTLVSQAQKSVNVL